MAPIKVFIDTDVLIDLFTDRAPYAEASAKLLSLADSGHIEIVVSSLCYSNLSYLLSKLLSKKVAIVKLQKLNAIVTTGAVTKKEIDLALTSDFSDFEDAIQYYTALATDCEVLISRNIKDYKTAKIPVMSAADFIRLENWNPPNK